MLRFIFRDGDYTWLQHDDDDDVGEEDDEESTCWFFSAWRFQNVAAVAGSLCFHSVSCSEWMQPSH